MLGSTLAIGLLRLITGTQSSITTNIASTWMGLLTSEPVVTVGDTGVVTSIDFSAYEPPIGTSAYARECIGYYSNNFTWHFGNTVYYNSASKYYYVTNTSQIKFNKAEATWMANGTSTITHFGIFNSSTGLSGANIVAWGELTTSIQVGANQAANIDVGDAELRIYAEVSA